MTGIDAAFLHASMLVVWLPALLAWRSLDRGTRLPRREAGLVGGVAALTYLAGLVHLVVLPEHTHESAVYGGFFAAAALAQLGYVVAVAARPTRRVLETGALVQVGLVVLWALTRTVGPPLGPQAWHPEPLGFLDGACALAEAGAVLLALAAVTRLRRCTPAVHGA